MNDLFNIPPTPLPLSAQRESLLRKIAESEQALATAEPFSHQHWQTVLDGFHAELARVERELFKQ